MGISALQTLNGWLEGFRYDPDALDYDGIPFSAALPNIPHNSTVFFGVPYATPPVGDFRWRSPQPVSSWSGLRQAKRKTPSCAQACDELLGECSEDCLYMNIFVPNRAIDENDQVAVAIWFHGGAFRWGQGGTILYDARLISGQDGSCKR